MATLLLRDVPEHLHMRLKQRARRNRRSVNSELLALVEAALQGERMGRPGLEELDPERVRPSGSLTWEEVRQAIDEGRE